MSEPRAKQGASVLSSAQAADRSVFERLRAHRAELARSKGFPAYVVASDRTLMELAIRRPRTLGELSTISGFGPSRIDSYGDGFLRVLADA